MPRNEPVPQRCPAHVLDVEDYINEARLNADDHAFRSQRHAACLSGRDDAVAQREVLALQASGGMCRFEQGVARDTLDDSQLQLVGGLLGRDLVLQSLEQLDRFLRVIVRSATASSRRIVSPTLSSCSEYKGTFSRSLIFFSFSHAVMSFIRCEAASPKKSLARV